MPGRLVTRLAGTGIKLMGSVLKGAGSLVQKAGGAAPRGAKDDASRADARRSRHTGGDRSTG